ncbi:MAG: hypothetical protein JWQ73_18, partial [Variovorax sp.]|nr:hypothetical protein [Variovorax sp.]
KFKRGHLQQTHRMLQFRREGGGLDRAGLKG